MNNDSTAQVLQSNTRRVRTTTKTEKLGRSFKIDPRCTMAYANWGLALARMGKRAEAEEKWSKAVELNAALKAPIEKMREQLLGKE